MRKLVVILLLGCVIPAPLRAQDRIVTAGSAVTETVCALGDCDKIVGADRTSLYPAEIQQRPSIGYRSGIHAEGVLSLRPTLVIAEKDYIDQAVLRQLAAASVRLVVIDRPLSVEGTTTLIKEVARALNRDKEGDSLIAQINADLAEVKTLLEKRNNSPRVACVFNRGTATVTAGGRGSFAEILQYVGAQNVFADIHDYKPLNAEAVIRANPDYLLMVSSGYESLGGTEGVLRLPGVSLTTAGKKKQIIAMETLKLTSFGPRLGEAVRELAGLLYPGLSR